MRTPYLFALCLALALYACGSSKNENENPDQIRETTNRVEDLDLGRQTGREFYADMLTCDSTVIQDFFGSEIDSFIPSLVHILQERHANWGALDTLYIKPTWSSYRYNSKTDTTDIKVLANAVYEYNEFEDILYIRKIGKEKPFLNDYGLQRITMIECSKNELETKTPYFQDVIEDLLEHEDDNISWIFDHDPLLWQDTKLIRDRDLPQEIFEDAEVEFHNGYMRKFCGSQSPANGFLTYRITPSDTSEKYLTLMVNKNEDDDTYLVYDLYLNGSDNYNREEDKNMAKQLAREVFRMLERHDHKAFFNALHEDARPKKNGRPYTDEDIKAMVDDYASWGTFEDFYSITTLSMDYEDTGGEKGSLVRYVVIAQLKTDTGEEEYVELFFRADASGKLRLSGFEYM